MDKLYLTRQTLGQVFNSRSGCMSCHALTAQYIQPNLEFKTRPKQLLGYLPLDVELPDETYLSQNKLYILTKAAAVEPALPLKPATLHQRLGSGSAPTSERGPPWNPGVEFLRCDHKCPKKPRGVTRYRRAWKRTTGSRFSRTPRNRRR